MKGIIVFIFFGISCAVNAQVTEEKVSWDYPVKPGTEERKALFTHKKMIEACQIPFDVLKSLTTKELINLCINYPLQFEFVAYDNLQTNLF